ncbi:MAG: serine hydrolase [Bacteroidales bacterium]|nr:serine hydrolase [Bacteroidales bacterium]
MRKIKNGLIVLLFTAFSFGICKAQVYPDNSWINAENPIAMGWGESERSAFMHYLIDSTHITGLLIIQQGKIVFEYGDIEENSYIASCRKSVLALLYGKYVENGTIKLDKTLGELSINDVSELLPIEKTAKISDVISARSGVYLHGSNGGDLRSFAPERGTVKPGEHWLYSNWDFNVAGYIFEQETKKSIFDEVETQLAIPLHMEDWDKSLQQKMGNYEVSKFPAYHMWFSTRDMARIGLLMLRKGQWKGQQIIPEFWINEIVAQRTSYSEAQKSAPVLKKDGLDLGYGYMWWLIENTNDYRMKNAFSAQGAIGQNITVFPEIDVVVAYKTKSIYRRRNSIQTQMEILKKAIEMYHPKTNNL